MPIQSRYLVAGGILSLWALATWFVVRTPEPTPRPAAAQPKAAPAAVAQVDPALKARFTRIQTGMTLQEVEAIMGRQGQATQARSSGTITFGSRQPAGFLSLWRMVG